MGGHIPGGFAQYIRGLAGFLRADPRSDADLLAAFVQTGDQAAFTALVARHGPAVWAACRRTLGDGADAEDAFQAAFIALARKAAAVRPNAVAGWLARVARDVAANAGKAARRREAAHRRFYDQAVPPTVDPPDDNELRAAVQEELAGLPERLRVPLTLYYLEGKTQSEVGRLFGVTEQAAALRLRRGLDVLRGRMARRGMAVTSAALAAVLGNTPAVGAVPAGLVAAAAGAALEAVAGAPSVTTAARLAAEVTRASIGPRLIVLGVLTVAAAGAAAGGVLSVRATSPDPVVPLAAADPPPAAPALPAPRLDRFGDPLPDGAVTRIGTTRFRTGRFPGEASVALSPDGQTIYSVDGGDAVRTWAVATGKEGRAVPGPRNGLGVALSPDGRRLVAGGIAEVWAWDLTPDGARFLWKHTPNGTGYWCTAFAPDGRTVACGGDNEHAILLIDAASGEVRKTLDGRGHRLAFSHDGRTIASWGRFTCDVCLWDTATGEKRHTLACGTDPNLWVNSFSFSADDRTLATAGQDRTIRLWDVATGKARVLTDAAGMDVFVGFEPGGNVLVEAGDERLRFWDAATGKECRPEVAAPQLATNTTWDACRLSADGRLLVSASPTTVGVWDVRTGRPVGPAGVPTGQVFSLAFSPDGRDLGLTALTADSFFVPQVYDTRTGQFRGEFRLPRGTGPDTAVLLPPVVVTVQQEVVVPGVRAAGMDVTAGVCATWRPGAKEPAIETVAEGSRAGLLVCPVPSPDGRLLAANRPGSVAVTDRASGKVVLTVKIQTDAAHLVFAPDGGSLACWEATEGTAGVSVWDVRTGGRLGGWKVDSADHLPATPPLALAPGGRRLAVGTSSIESAGKLQVWDVAAGDLVWEAALPANPASAVAFSPDGRALATGGTDGLTRVWEAVSGQERIRRAGHRAAVMAVAFSPDGGRVASGSADTTALVWEVRPESGAALKPDPEALWAVLTGGDAAAAYRAVAALAETPGVAVPLLRERLRPPPPAPEQVKRWVAELGHERFDVREAAMRELARKGDLVEPALRAALKTEPSPERAARLRQLLRRLEPRSAYKLGIVRGVEVLERASGDPAARKLLAEFADAPADSLLGQEARAAARRLAQKPPAP